MTIVRWGYAGGLAAALLLAVPVQAQMLGRPAPYGFAVASDFDAPYERELSPRYGSAPVPYDGPVVIGRDGPAYPPRGVPDYGRDYSRGDGPAYGPGAEPGYAPSVLPPVAVYDILRRAGYSPLGVPRQRGYVYTIAALGPNGDDGRLVIDARSGRILRFMPAWRMGDRMNEETTASYGPAGAPPPSAARPRPQAALPKLASRDGAVPLPLRAPHAVTVKNAPQRPAPAIAAPASQPADAQASIAPPAQAAAPVPAAPTPATAPAEAKPPLASTGEMPPVQPLD